MLRTTLLLSCLILVTPARAQEDHKPAPEQHERLRTYDVQHIKAELSIDPAGAQLSGTVTHTIKPLHDGLKKVELDCESLSVLKVTVGGKAVDFELQEPRLAVTLDRVYRTADQFELAVTYRGSPTRGMYFIRPDEFYPDKPLCVWTQGEPEQNHFWLPCYDYPNDMATTEMIITAPAELFVLSNGTLVETRQNEQAGTRTFHWRMDQPHVTYLISLVVADLVSFEERVDDLLITSYVPRKMYNEGQVRRAFGRTGEMARFFNRRIGVPYPWPKYAQVIVPEFRSGGMENISSTTLTEFTLRDDAAALESSADGLIAHELAHQWWGDLVTCQDWSHLWLNEGFATYFDALFVEYDKGDDEFAYEMRSNQRRGISVDEKKPRPVVWRGYERPFEMFDARAYPKGASILHMLRGFLGEETFFRGLSTYARQHANRPVKTSDLQEALEKVSGKKLDWFFQQWCYQAGAPKLEVSWRWNGEDSTVRVTVKQTQKTSELVPVFRLPTFVEFIHGKEKRRIPMVLDRKEHELIVPLDKSPQLVLVDPEHYLLAQIKMNQPAARWRYQLEHAQHVLARADAAEALGAMKSSDENVAALVAALKREKSKYLRRDIIKALGKLKGDAVRDAVLTATTDAEAIVRREAVEQLEHFSGDQVLAALRDRWQKEIAPATRAAILKQLANKKAVEVESLVEQALRKPSYRATVARAAFEVVTEGKHPRARELLMLRSRRGENLQVRVAAVGAIGKLAKEDASLRKMLEELVIDEDYFVRRAAISALADAGELTQIKFLEERLGQPSDKRELDALRKAVEKIRSRQPKDPEKLAEQKAAAIEAEAQQLEAKARRLFVEAEQVRAEAKEKSAGKNGKKPAE